VHEAVLGPETRRAMEALANVIRRRKFYLAGETGCALHLGHRVSLDLDFFSADPFEPADIQRDLRLLGGGAADYTDAATWVGRYDGTKVGFFHYFYPLLAPVASYEGISVASLEDIGCMKLEAIAGRGKKRDFIDFAFVLARTGIDLKSFLELAKRKYGPDLNLYHVLKSLVFFADADSDPDPKMLVEFSWPGIKKSLTAQVKSAAFA
jgi:hypothetical protein